MSDDAGVLTMVNVRNWPPIATGLPQRTAASVPSEAAAPVGAAQRSYTVILASGRDDMGKRATLAFAAASAAMAMDLDTQVFLIGDGSYWAYEGTSDPVSQPGFPPLSELMDGFIQLGGRVYICAACDTVCSLPGDGADPRRRRREIEPRGLAAVMSDMVGGTSVTF